MRPQLVIDNAFGNPPVINFLRAITASTLLEILPTEMTALLDLLDETPASTPSCPPTVSRSAAAIA